MNYCQPGQTLLFSSESQHHCTLWAGALAPVSNPWYKRPPACLSPDQISFDLQVEVDQEICKDLEGWIVWQKNRAVCFHSLSEGLEPSGVTAPQFHVALQAIALSSTLYLPAPLLTMSLLQQVWQSGQIPAGILGPKAKMPRPTRSSAGLLDHSANCQGRPTNGV